MSRVTYTDTPATHDQGLLRTAHRVRLVAPAEEGSGVNLLPGGVYGFTYSPGLVNSPLFAVRRYRCYETHKLESGEVFLIGFTTPEEAATLHATQKEATITILPEPGENAHVLVKVPYERIHRHRQYCAPNEHGFSLTVLPTE